MTNLPTGNGMFIWLLSRTEGGDPVKAAQKAKDSGLSWVAIKVTDGPYAFNFSQDSAKRDLVPGFVDAFKKLGIAVWGWGYAYGYYPEQEAQAAVNRINQLDLAGWFIDAEGEYKGKPSQATRLMTQFRRLSPGTSLGLCSYRFPSYHPTFPWAQFSTCDFNAPQVYWMGAHNAGAQLQRTYSEFSGMAGYKNMPLIPIGASFSEWGWTPGPAELVEFRQKALSMHLPGYGWWEWYEASTRHPEFWTPATGAVAVPVADGVIEKVVTRYTDLRIRSLPSLNGAILGYMAANRVYEIVEISGPWGRIAGSTTQWVNLGYVIKVA